MYVQQMQPCAHSVRSKFVLLERDKIYETLHQTLSRCQPKLFWHESFIVNMVVKALAICLKNFVCNIFASTVRSNKIWRTIKNFKALFPFPTLSKKQDPYTKFHF